MDGCGQPSTKRGSIVMRPKTIRIAAFLSLSLLSSSLSCSLTRSLSAMQIIFGYAAEQLTKDYQSLSQRLSLNCLAGARALSSFSFSLYQPLFPSLPFCRSRSLPYSIGVALALSVSSSLSHSQCFSLSHTDPTPGQAFAQPSGYAYK